MLNPPKLIGHRGVKNLSPENTLNSIEFAYKIGLNWVEIDVKISKDNIPILLHDDTLNRTTTGKGSPNNFYYKEIKEFDAGLFFSKKSTHVYVPTLKEVLSYCEKKNMCLNIELKPNLGFEKENIISITKLLKNFNFKNEYYFSSFDLNSLIFMKNLMPNSYYGLLIDDFNKNISLENVLDICKKYNFFCCGSNNNIINSDIISRLKENNLLTNIYSEKNLTLNEAIELWSKGVCSIFTDDPSEFKLVNC